MKIIDKLKVKKPLVSFEIFPPKRDYPVDTIYETIDALQNMDPDFISVTYGAGGSTRGTTVEVASYIESKYQIASLAHLTCLTSSKNEVKEILEDLKQQGVQNILALRGDLPAGTTELERLHTDFNSALDLIEQITKYNNAQTKVENKFCIGAACYPEGHPKANSEEEEFEYLKEKVDAGAEFLVTQLFFDNELFYNFMEKKDKYKINVPVFVGLMPVLNTKQVERMVELTNCTVSPRFQRIMQKYEHNPEALREAGIAYAIEQSIDLLSWGVDGIHLYTMNRPDTTREIIERLQAIRGALTAAK